MTDGFLYRSLPAFTGLLVFMPACGADDPPATDTDATDGSSSSAETSATQTTTQGESTGPDETSTSSPTDPTSDSSGESGPEVCPADSLCAASLPEAWFGPLIVARTPQGEAPPECPPEFPDDGPDLLDGFVSPGPAQCTCECEAPAVQNCYASVVVSPNPSCYGYYYYYGGYNQVSEACSNVDLDGFARFQLFGFYGPGMCTSEQTELIPPLDWEAEIKTCQLPDTPLDCEGDGICIPPPAPGFESRWCMYQQGDVGCPAGVFNTKHKFYMGAEDSRECSDCTCGSSPASCDMADLLVFEGSDCAGEPITSIASNSECIEVLAGSVAVDYGLSAGCPVGNPGSPMGVAEPTGVFTFCCTG